jgi:glycerol-3-phosphate dehydrogenase
MIPKTDDGRVLFAVPWHNHIVVGTTDTPINTTSLEPVALEQEVNFILNTMGRYLTRQPSRSDVLSVFAGLRPLAAPKGDSTKTKEISRSHKIFITQSNLFTMVGGKWTTFRQMAQDMVEKVESTLDWKKTKTKTKNLPIHGYVKTVDHTSSLYWYGSDIDGINQLVANNSELGEYISKSLGIIKAQVVWAVQNEMAFTVEDVLSRRTRCLLLNAREAITIAPVVANIMAKELGKNSDWEQKQVDEFNRVASMYILR